MDWRLPLGDPTLDIPLWIRASMPLYHIYIFYDCPLPIGKDAQNSSRLSPVFAGQYVNLIISFYVEHGSNSCQ